MPVYVSTSCLRNTSNVFDVLKAYAEAGLSNVELGVAHRHVGELSPHGFKRYGFNFLCHHYFPPPAKPFIVNLASQDMMILKQSKEQIKRSIEFCCNLGIRLFTFHAGFRADPDEKFKFHRGQQVAPYETAFNTFLASVEELNSYALERGVGIAIENNVLSDYNVVDGQNPFLLLCEAEEFERLWERIPSANVGILLDLGHLKVTSHWLNFDRYQFIDRVRDRVFAIHLHENNGRLDEHRELDKTSWCFEVISRKYFSGLPVVLESVGLTVNQIVHEVSAIEKTLSNEQI